EAAGEALPATLMGGKAEEVFEIVDDRVFFRDADDRRVAEEETFLGKGVEVDRQAVDLLHRYEAAERAADMHRLDGAAEAAAEFDDDVAERRAHVHLVDAGAAEVAVERDKLRARRSRCADGSVGLAAVGH